MAFSHLDADQRPTMVDVSGKSPALRTAIAETRVRFPAAVAEALRGSGFRSAKGPVFDTAIVAGIMGAKRTSELIPLCHPLPLTHCEVNFDIPKTQDRIVITATAKIAAQTGVEMEALTAVSVAALTIYDMCKAVDKTMRVTNIVLVSKTKR